MPRPILPPGPGRPKGLKNKATIAREERRAIFDKEMSEMFLDKIRKARPEYLLDQFLGKAEEKVKINLESELSPELKELTQQLNAIYGGTSRPSNGRLTGSMDDQAQDKE